MKTLFKFLVSSIVIIVFAATGLAQTEVSGIISSDTTWTLTGSPYIVVGSVLVSSGVTLTIEQGVTVKFDNGKAIQIDGTLIAQGTSIDNITFTTNSQGDYWGYILFSDSSNDATYDVDGNYTGSCILEYCIVEYAGSGSVDNNGALRMNNAHPFINHCTICNNSASGIKSWNLSGILKITNSTISNNTAEDYGGGIAISVSTCTSTISGNIITNNVASWGGGIFASTGDYSDGTINIDNNKFRDNNSFYKGGAIYAFVQGNTINITNNTLSNNTSCNGGAIYAHMNNGSITIINSIVIGSNSSGSGGGIYAHVGNSSFQIGNSIISDNICTAEGGGIYIYPEVGGNCCDSYTTITNNSIIRNRSSNIAGVYYYSESDYSLSYNTIMCNIASSITNIGGIYVICRVTNPAINNNNIYNNNGYELYNGNDQGSDNVNAENNWWGTAVESEIEAKIYHWLDDSDKGLVDYIPYETSIRTDAPISPPTGLTITEGTGNITLNWSANTEGDLAGYKVYWDTDSGYPYANVVDVGNVTYSTITGLAPGTYYVTVTAYDNDYAESNNNPNTIVNENQTSGNESWYAEEVSALVPVVGLQSNGENIPSEYSLSQNYPNPFNPSTTILYQLPKQSFVKLSIYDISGRLVTTLVNEHKNAGYYSVEWNVHNVASGIYIYRIDAGKFSSVRKCLVVK